MSRSKAVVFMGGSAPELELIRAFQDSGLRVVVVDRNAAAPGGAVADAFINCSITDAPAVQAGLERLEGRYAFVAAYGVVDDAYVTIGRVAPAVGIAMNAPELYRDFTNKLLTKARLVRHAVPTPRTLARGHAVDRTDLRGVSASPVERVVVKASVGCNSEGVRIVRSTDTAALAAAASRCIDLCGEYFCEQYVSGTLHNLDMVLNNKQAFVVAITDRFRLTDGITSVAGVQESPERHPRFAAFTHLAHAIHAAFADYRGPLTADVLASGDELFVLEISPHLHASKLQALRDARVLATWPRLLAGDAVEPNYLRGGAAASAYIRLYDGVTTASWFEPAWLAQVEEFDAPRQIGAHALTKILYLQSDAAAGLRARVEAFVNDAYLEREREAG